MMTDTRDGDADRPDRRNVAWLLMSIGGLDMRGDIAFLAVAAAGAVLSGGPAYADPAPRADVQLVYGHPEVTGDSTGITWRWELGNKGTAAADAVVATHRVSAGQQLVGVSPPCVAGPAGDVVCRFASLRPGEKRSGWIKTGVTRWNGTLRINAQLTWREPPSVASALDAGPAGVPSPAGAPRAPGIR
jgi:hypothetical protein